MAESGRRGGVPAAVWWVAGLLWVISTVAVAVLGDHPVQASRAALFAVACVGAGAVITLAMIVSRRWCLVVVTLLLINASQLGRGYLDSDDPVTGTQVVVVVVGTVAAIVVSRAIAGRLPQRFREPSPA